MWAVGGGAQALRPEDDHCPLLVGFVRRLLPVVVPPPKDGTQLVRHLTSVVATARSPDRHGRIPAFGEHPEPLAPVRRRAARAPHLVPPKVVHGSRMSVASNASSPDRGDLRQVRSASCNTN